MVRVNISGLMALAMKESGIKVWSKDLENGPVHSINAIRDVGFKIKQMEMALCIGLLKNITKENGLTLKNMVLEKTTL